MDAVERVRQFIETHRLLRPGERVVAAVSGGADSLCLLDVLHRLAYDVRVVHVDHQLRPESAAEAEFTRHTASAYGIEAQVEKADVRPHGQSLEEAARLARYEILGRAAHACGADVLATGHTADDQAETILMHFLRGAGPEGLRGMLPSTDLGRWVDVPSAAGLRLVRPLLGLQRADTLAHCAWVGLAPRYDASNEDRTFQRNRLRHELLPLLETYNPRIREALSHTGQIMAAASDLVSEQLEREWPSVVRAAEPGALRIRLAAYLGLPLAVQRSLLRQVAGVLQPRLRDVGWEATEKARHFLLDPPTTRQAEWLAGLELRHLGTEVVVSVGSPGLAFPEHPQLIGEGRQPIPVPGRVDLARGWALEACAVPAGSPPVVPDPGGRQAVFDGDTLTAPLALRPPAPGDRMQPLGLAGSTKIAELLINRHIPRPARGRWPIVVAGEVPIWVVGLRQAEQAKLTEHTRRAILLRLIAP